MTWSILARDPESGALGLAVATRFFAVGALCLHGDGGVGAIATQALVNPTFGPQGLRLLRQGLSPEETLRRLLESDPGAAHRQLHILAPDGRSARHTGSDCVSWCGHVGGQGYSVAGNMLAGPEVITETARTFEACALPFPRRLITALKAGERAGGDKRGKQSAALSIYTAEEYPALSLRVDDHADPLAELDRLEQVSRERFVHFRRFLPTRANPGGVFDRDVIEAEITKAFSAETGQARTA